MVSLSGFNAADHEPVSFDVVPAGMYEAVIVASAEKPTRDGHGKYIELELQVLNGQFQNRKIWDRLNMWNRSDKAVEIARATLSAICRAVGVLTPNDTSELHNRPLVVKVAVRKSDEYGESNEVRGYYPRQAGGQQSQSNGYGPSISGDGPPAGARPW